jgi:hypothetical protein
MHIKMIIARSIHTGVHTSRRRRRGDDDDDSNDDDDDDAAAADAAAAMGSMLRRVCGHKCVLRASADKSSTAIASVQ